MTLTIELTPEQMDICLSASTAAEIDEAERQLREYIRLNPTDGAILECGEVLQMARTYPREQIALEQEQGELARAS
jgi:hypothetical protein